MFAMCPAVLYISLVRKEILCSCEVSFGCADSPGSERREKLCLFCAMVQLLSDTPVSVGARLKCIIKQYGPGVTSLLRPGSLAAQTLQYV